jgi:hypothetical protein
MHFRAECEYQSSVPRMRERGRAVVDEGRTPLRHRTALERGRRAVGRGSGMGDVVPDERGLSGHEAAAVEIQRGRPTIDRSVVRCPGWKHQETSRADASMCMHDFTKDQECHGQYGNRRTHACQQMWRLITSNGAADYSDIKTDSTGMLEVSCV